MKTEMSMDKRFGFKRIASLILAIVMVLCVSPAAFAAGEAETSALMTPEQAKAADLAAFPGAEGGGKYTTGGRGGEVYHVTNLNDDGEGSLRDAISQPNRIIVFDVSGTIHLKSALRMEQPNITIAGQTAPGDGICVGDYNIVIAADNVIIRYVRFRPGDISHAENDAIFARYNKDIILDHCSTSWSTDETMSLYGVANTTVQWCVISESLAMAVHAKGRHGYGGIWGGANTTYHHNLVATHTSRLPRYYSANNSHPEFKDSADNDMVNNVIYNWGFNNAYGGEKVTVNVINNYYKPGPITNNYVLGRIWNPSNEGVFYFSGNVLEGNAEVTNDNIKGVHYNEGVNPIFNDKPTYDYLIPMDNIDTAEDAYTKILAGAGATIPKRDSYDAKIINDTKNGTGRSINNEDEVAGWPELNSAEAPKDTDRDGMPDEYEDRNGLDKNNAGDGKAFASNGYTNLENYLNNIVETASEPQNPDVTLNIENNAIYDYGKSISLTASASAKSGRSIKEVEFFRNDELIGTAASAPYSVEYKNAPEGVSYMSARAVDSVGEATLSEIKVMNVNYTDPVGDWKTLDIGNATMKGGYSYHDGRYTIKSSGLIGAGNEFNVMDLDPKTDDFSFMYKEADTNSVISAKIESVSKLNNNCVSGVMMRDELTNTSDFVMLNYEHEKGGAGLSFVYRLNGEYNKKFLRLAELPRYVKLVKIGNTITGFHSPNGIDWEYFAEVDMGFGGTDYAGLAQDGNKETNQISTYSWGRFSDLSLDNYGTNSIPDIALRTGALGEDGSLVHKGQFLVQDNIELWIASSELASSDKMEVYVDGVLSKTFDTPQERVTLEPLQAGNHYITAVIYDADGAKNSATQNVGVSSFEADWSISEIHYPKNVQENGNTIRHGAFDQKGDKLTIYGTGYGIEGVENEEYPCMYTEMSGDFTASFKVDPQTFGTDYEQMGFVVRNSLETSLEDGADGTSYAAYFQKYNGELFRKTDKYGKTYELIGQQKYKKTPVWISLEKSGSTMTMKYSQDGSEWMEVGTTTLDNLNENYYFGVFGASNEEYKIAEFSISEFKFESHPSTGYVDMAGYDWAAKAVNALTEQGITEGDVDQYGNRYFYPYYEVTRAEFAKMIVEAYKAKNPEAQPVREASATQFADAPATDSTWYIPYIYEAYNYGLTDGTYYYENDKAIRVFAPGGMITREEMAAMVSRAMPGSGVGTISETGSLFADTMYISDWALPFVASVKACGVMQGDENNCFNPQKFADRAEAAQVIYNYLYQK